MKKKGIALISLLLVGFLFSPINAKALAYNIFATTASRGRNVTVGKDGNSTLDGDYEPTGSLKIPNNGADTVVYVGMVLKEGTIDSDETITFTVDFSDSTGYTFTGVEQAPGSEWELIEDETVIEDDKLTVVVAATGEISVSEDSSYISVMVKISIDGTNATDSENCHISLALPDEPTPDPENPTCTIDGETYYCADGSICTEEQYNSDETCNPENPTTGSFLPYAVIAGASIVAIGLYTVSKKNKIYHM